MLMHGGRGVPVRPSPSPACQLAQRIHHRFHSAAPYACHVMHAYAATSGSLHGSSSSSFTRVCVACTACMQVYQYNTFTNFEPKVLNFSNPEIPDEL